MNLHVPKARASIRWLLKAEGQTAEGYSSRKAGALADQQRFACIPKV